MTEAFLVTGRRVSDWHACGKRIPDDVVLIDCLNCSERLTISPEAAARLAKAELEGYKPAGGLCTACSQKIVEARAAAGLTVQMTGTTRAGAEALKTSPRAAGLVAALRRAGAKI